MSVSAVAKAEVKNLINVDLFSAFEAAETERKTFLEILHHIRKGNLQVIRMEKMQDQDALCDDESAVCHYASTNLDKIADLSTVKSEMSHLYVTVNEFFGHKRVAAKCGAICALFIDLDGHDFTTEDELDEAIKTTQDRLSEAYESGEMLRPTMITHTGRGMGLYYVLDRSIACLRDNAVGHIRFAKRIHEMLMKEYERILSGDKHCYLKVDTSTTDLSRVCRLPGTYNCNAQRACHLYHVLRDEKGLPYYYNLNAFKSVCSEWHDYTAEEKQEFAERKAKKEQKREEIKAKMQAYKENKKDGSNVIDFNSYRNDILQKQRLNTFLQIADAMQEVDSGFRDEILFQIYNAAVVLMSKDDAKLLVRETNQEFSNPLKETDLCCVWSAVDKYGHYKQSSEKIALKLSNVNINISEFNLSVSEKVLQAAKKREEKQQRNETILKLRQEHPTYSRIELCEAVREAGYECSARTIDRVLKKADMSFNRGKSYDEIVKYERKAAEMHEKVDKKSLIYVSVAKTENSIFVDNSSYAFSFLIHLKSFYNNRTFDAGIDVLKSSIESISDSDFKTDIINALAYMGISYSNTANICVPTLVMQDLSSVYDCINHKDCKFLKVFGKKVKGNNEDWKNCSYPENFEWHDPSEMMFVKKSKKDKSAQNKKLSPDQWRLYIEYENQVKWDEYARGMSFDYIQALRGALVEYQADNIEGSSYPYYTYKYALKEFLKLGKRKWNKLTHVLDPIKDMDGYTEKLEYFDQAICKEFNVSNLRLFVAPKKKKTEKQVAAWSGFQRVQAMWSYIDRLHTDNDSIARSFGKTFSLLYKGYKDNKNVELKKVFNAMSEADIKAIIDNIKQKADVFWFDRQACVSEAVLERYAEKRKVESHCVGA